MSDKKNKVYNNETLGETSRLLDLNPEFNAIWNYRRNILTLLFASGERSKKKALEEDLAMVMLMLKRFPKCYWIWNHRYWCLAQLEDEANWKYELGIVLKLLELDSRNFHGWHYRRYVIENMEALARKAVEGDEKKQLLAELQIDLMDFQYTTEKINQNLSNFSAWHNRSNLIPKIFKGLQEVNSTPPGYEKLVLVFELPSALLKHDLLLLKTGIYMDAEDSSVWLYMHWLVSTDLFVEDLKAKSDFVPTMEQLLKDVEELNELEKNDNQGRDNVWCLKMTVVLHALLETDPHALHAKVRHHLNRLIELDPLRKGHYEDQLAGEAPLL